MTSDPLRSHRRILLQSAALAPMERPATRVSDCQPPCLAMRLRRHQRLWQHRQQLVFRLQWERAMQLWAA